MLNELSIFGGVSDWINSKPPRKSLILSGKSGKGKTILARALSDTFGESLFIRHADELKN
jgi:DNA replication protein DnaC